MYGNYEWQKHEANERVRARLREAEAHRLVKEGENGRSPRRRAWLARLFAAWRRTEKKAGALYRPARRSSAIDCLNMKRSASK